MVLRYFGLASEDGANCSGGVMRTAILLTLAAFLAIGAGALHIHQPTPPSSVRVRLDNIPPDACVTVFGPGPCRPHGGMPTTGQTDAVAGPPPEVWQGKVR